MTKKYLFLAGLLLFIFSGRSVAQSKSALEDQAYDYLNNNEFAKAYEAFDQLHAKYPKELDYEFKLGICCLSYPEKKERAIEIFMDMRNKYKTREAEFYLGRAYHANYRFDEALAVLEPMAEALSASKKKEEKTLYDNAIVIISNCKNGKVLQQSKISYSITNVGAPINTKEVEGAPVITADESMMIFTYVGKKSLGGKMNDQMDQDPNGIYTSDIYMTTRNPDLTWKAPTPITALNTKGNDAAIALSSDGLTLFTFLSTNEIMGDIYMSKLNGTEFSKPVPLNKNVNTFDYWEGSCSISADGQYLYFTSDRPTGLGGRDIWVSKMVDGDWGPAVNLGPSINTPYDDDAPFIHPDGVTLFFSSKGHSSIGGYDIMYSTKLNDNDTTWTEPRNMGMPLNTTEDDSYYVINSKGNMGYFSSDRSSASAKGGQDIYSVNPGIIGEKLIVALYKGVITGDGRPIEARIDVVKESKNENLGPYFSNKTTGKYLLTFKPGSSYKIKIYAEGYEPYEEEINLETLSNYKENKRNYNLYSKAFAESNPDKAKVNAVEISPDANDLGGMAGNNPAYADSLKKQQQIELARQAAELDKQERAHLAVERFKEEQKQASVAKATTPSTEEKQAAAEAKAEEKRAIAAAKAEEKRAREEEKKSAALARAEEKKAIAEARAEEKRRKQEVKEQGEDVAATEAPSPCDGTLPELSNIKGKSLNDPEVYRQMLEMAGGYCADGVVYKVQIGAYKNPDLFDYKRLKSLGKIESEIYPDGITRFTQREFRNLKDAEKHRQKAIAKGQTDSWIVVFANGKRYTLEEFIMLDFLGKAIN